MAPEQFRDPKSVDVRADIYAFGVVLFEMITGQLPFKGRSMEVLDDQHSLYPPGSVVPSIPARHAKLARPVDAIVQRCLKKDPEDRFRSVAELRQAIKQVAALIPSRAAARASNPTILARSERRRSRVACPRPRGDGGPRRSMPTRTWLLTDR